MSLQLLLPFLTFPQGSDSLALVPTLHPGSLSIKIGPINCQRLRLIEDYRGLLGSFYASQHVKPPRLADKGHHLVCRCALVDGSDLKVLLRRQKRCGGLAPWP